MKPDIHQQARELIACTGSEQLSQERSSWLRDHLQECAPCREYAAAASQVAAAMRAIPVAADRNLVRTTQLRVRLHAQKLQQQRDRMRLVWMSCTLLFVSGALTTPLLWRSFHWMGEMAQLSTPVWQGAFVMFWIVPALTASIFLIARGIHLRDDSRRLME